MVFQMVFQTTGSGFCDSFAVGGLNIFARVLALAIISATIDSECCA